LRPEKILPRYFLHVGELNSDPDGTELPNMEAARHEAVLVAREMLAESIRHTIENVPTQIIVADEAGNVLAVVYMRDVIPRALRECPSS
jgi:hypothetical protein